jgi:hypothetical protein
VKWDVSNARRVPKLGAGGTWSSGGSPWSLDKGLLDYSIKVGCYFQRSVELMRLLINELDIIKEVGEVKL